MEIKELADMLNKYPDIKERLKEMLEIVEGPNRGEFRTADAIEEETVGVVRKIGQDLVQNWASQQAIQTSEQIGKQVSSAKKDRKKKSTGRPPSAKLK